MCGLLGWSGRSPRQFDVHKFNILGIMNETRGKHSCGIAYNGEIYGGIGLNSDWRDFCTTHTAELSKKDKLQSPVVIGHTRSATSGGHTLANAHPFGFGTYKEGFSFVGAHNGTLINHEELANYYNIELKEEMVHYKRTKIDSELLLEIIYEKGFKVLGEYNGSAALIFQDIKRPNTVYVYRGESGMYKNAVYKTSERPLFYYQESKNSLYFSSLKDSLKAIKSTEGEIEEFECNIVYEITNGDLSTAVKHKVDRSDNFQRSYTTTGYGRGTWYSREEEKKETPHNLITYTFSINKEIINHKNTSDVYYNKLRYWQDYKLCNGIYTPLKNKKMFFLAKTENKALTVYNTIKSINKYQRIPLFYYIYQGVMLETAEDYKVCLASNRYSNVYSLSHMSRYPIIDLDNSKGRATRKNIRVSGKFLPLLSNKIYNAKKGRITEYEDRHKDYIQDIKAISHRDISYYELINKEIDKDEEQHSKFFIKSCKEELLKSIKDQQTDSELEMNKKNSTIFITTLESIGLNIIKTIEECLEEVVKKS